MARKRIEKEEVENKKTDKEVTKKNETAYSEANVVNRIQRAEHLRTSVGDKTKIIETVTYKNGVAKSKCKGIIKGKHVISNSGIDEKFLKGN